MVIAQLDTWTSDPDPQSFPFDQVVTEFHRVGKHFVSPEILAGLDSARKAATDAPQTANRELLLNFLDIALDKYDQRYDYLTYTAVALLPAAAHLSPSEALQLRDRQVLHLVCDALAFELAATSGEPLPLPGMRPSEPTVRKRCHHGLRVVLPVLARIGLAVDTHTDEIATGRQVCTDVRAKETSAYRQMLRLSMLPVYTLHDEYLFLRVLQSFEVNFSLIAAYLHAVIAALKRDPPDTATAVQLLESSTEMMHEAAPLFSLLATMQVESFRTFRTYTEGASAIQSERAKTVESLCRRPDPQRLDSLAYTSVPRVRERILAGQETVYDTCAAAREDGKLSNGQAAELAAAMDSLEAAHHRWRKTHYSLAVHMLGEQPGTGYTVGPPYLKSVINNELFRPAHETGTEEEKTS